MPSKFLAEQTHIILPFGLQLDKEVFKGTSKGEYYPFVPLFIVINKRERE